MDTCKPGGRISVVGVYKAIAPRATGSIGGVFKAVVVANSVRQLSREADRELTADDIRYRHDDFLCASKSNLPNRGLQTSTPHSACCKGYCVELT